jgi:hypothetical protein
MKTIFRGDDLFTYIIKYIILKHMFIVIKVLILL